MGSVAQGICLDRLPVGSPSVSSKSFCRFCFNRQCNCKSSHRHLRRLAARSAIPEELALQHFSAPRIATKPFAEGDLPSGKQKSSQPSDSEQLRLASIGISRLSITDLRRE